MLSVPPANWPALTLFLLLATQWRIAVDKPTGLDYGAIAPTAQLAGLSLSPSLFEKIRHMEQCALRIFATRQAHHNDEPQDHA